MVWNFNIIYNDLAVYVSFYLPITCYDLQYFEPTRLQLPFQILHQPSLWSLYIVSNKPVGLPIFLVHVSACWASHIRLYIYVDLYGHSRRNDTCKPYLSCHVYWLL